MRQISPTTEFTEIGNGEGKGEIELEMCNGHDVNVQSLEALCLKKVAQGVLISPGGGEAMMCDSDADSFI